MFAPSRKETDRGKTTSRRTTLRCGGYNYEYKVIPRTLQTRRRARAANTLGHAHRHKIDGAPCQDVAATKDMRPAQAKSTERSIGEGTCESCKLLKVEINIVRPDSVANIKLETNIVRPDSMANIGNIVRPDSVANIELKTNIMRPDSVANIEHRPDSVADIGGPRVAWPTSRPDSMADIGGPIAWPTSRPDSVAEIDDVHIDSAAAAGRCIEGGTCNVNKLPKAKMPSKNTRADELSAGTCAVTKDFTAHNDKKCGAARLTMLCRTTCRTGQQSARRCRRNRRQRHEASLSARAHALRAHIRTGEGYAFKAYLIAYTAA